MNIRRFRVLREEGPSYAEIARECGCDWRTVRKYLAEDGVAVPPRAPSRAGTQPQVIAPLAGVVDAWLRRDLTVRASLIHDRLVAEHGFPGSPLDPVVLLPQGPQAGHERRVPSGPGRGPASLGRVIRARRHLQHGADGLDAELVAVRVDERDYLLCWWSSSAPKKLAARLRISFARRSSRFSCSSSRSRAASLLLTPAACPSSMSACRTHNRTDSVPYPNWVATRPIVPWSVPSSARSARTIRTAAAFSSSEYRRVVGLPFDTSSGMAPSSFPRSGASKQPRAVHLGADPGRSAQSAKPWLPAVVSSRRPDRRDGTPANEWPRAYSMAHAGGGTLRASLSR